ncbi:MAG: oligosaccharide flippase family protein [Eubacteriales bacterium]|nr:oligosaccharide flippase family protein [Eubacteriales bacterium]
MRFPKKGSLVFSTALITATNLTVRALGFLLRVWLARRLGGEALGLYQLTFPCFGLFLTLITGGLPTAMAKLCAEPGCQPETILATTRRLAGVLFGVVGGGAALLSYPICRFFLGTADAWPAFLLMLPALWSCGRAAIYNGYFIGQKRFGPGAIAQVTAQLIRIGATVLFLNIRDLTPAAAAGLTMAGMTVGETAGLLVLRGFCRLKGPIGRMKGARRLISFSAPLTVMRLCATGLGALTAALIPSLLTVSGLSRADALDAFAALSGMAMPLLLLIGSVSLALGTGLVPSISAGGASPAIRQKARSALGFAAAIGLVFAAILFFGGNAIGERLYARSDVGAYLRLLAPMALLSGLVSVSTALLNGLGRSRTALRGMLAGQGLQLGLTLLTAVPALRVGGYLLALTAGHAVTALVNIIACQKSLRAL